MIRFKENPMPKSCTWYKRPGVMVPPFTFGRNVSQDDWFKMFPKSPKQIYESEEEYLERTKKANESGKDNE